MKVLVFILAMMVAPALADEEEHDHPYFDKHGKLVIPEEVADQYPSLGSTQVPPPPRDEHHVRAGAVPTSSTEGQPVIYVRRVPLKRSYAAHGAHEESE